MYIYIYGFFSPWILSSIVDEQPQAIGELNDLRKVERER